MGGTNSGRYAYYRCTRSDNTDQQKCNRSISAGPLEEFVRDVVIIYALRRAGRCRIRVHSAGYFCGDNAVC
ncbi:hypothetical protein ACFZCT_22350 [Streptomyces qaidamensis]|uniref:hypothetical protein n=1 Tax=Streptomyces qaidamensis TaxID=1783515 RepID=UPI0036E2D482